MFILITPDRKYVKEINLALDYPNTSFPKPLTADALPENVVEVLQMPQPTVTIFQLATLSQPIFDESLDRWVQQWAIVERTKKQKTELLLVEKTKKSRYINESAVLANLSTFIHDGVEFSSNASARNNINDVNSYVLLFNSMPPEWSGSWKAVDNTFYPISNVDEWKSFYASLAIMSGSNFAKAQKLKTEIEAIVTADSAAIDALSNIVW